MAKDKKMKFNFDEIKDLPVTTNKIHLNIDKEKFFSQYTIVSYYSNDADLKNLAYEQLADVPFESVSGIKARWNGEKQYTIFFVLSKKDKVNDIVKSLRKYDKICSKIDDLENYDNNIQQRIIASLAINSIGERKASRNMYNNGSLLLCDDKNFLIPKSRKELVCLKIDINEYLNLTAKTTSFSNPRNVEELRKKRHCIFQVSKDIQGQWWSGLAIKPIVIKKFDTDKINLEDLYIQRKRFPDTHNIVPYWPYNYENYIHGRLFAISQVVESVNAKYDGILNIQFVDFNVLHYDEYKTQKDMLTFLTNYMSNKCIYIHNPFGNKAEQHVLQMENMFKEVVGKSLSFHKKQKPNDMIIRLCEEKGEQSDQTQYTQSMSRFQNSCTALQHKIFHENNKNSEFTKSEARRILIELLVKDCLLNRCMPKELSSLITNWEFIRYKINDGCIVGASMKVSNTNNIVIKEYGFSKEIIDFENFAEIHLKFHDYEKIRGAKDYMALIKNNNVYLIIDTDEIPILDVSLIDNAYDEIVNKGEPLSLFKRKKDAHKYLRGYIGFHLWKTDGLDGKPESAYAYISGTNSENMQIMNSTKMDRMPRVRKVFILHNEHPSSIEDEIMDIAKMLKFGFGRWNEMMTYPFPFKFLQEHLDNLCEIAFCKHWNEITQK